MMQFNIWKQQFVLFNKNRQSAGKGKKIELGTIFIMLNAKTHFNPICAK